MKLAHRALARSTGGFRTVFIRTTTNEHTAALANSDILTAIPRNNGVGSRFVTLEMSGSPAGMVLTEAKSELATTDELAKMEAIFSMSL